jgi:type IV pilus assembly protein PilW
MSKHKAIAPTRRRGARGFSMVELMVAVAVSVFLLMGLFTVLQNTHNTSDNERLLAQLQDDERIAMTLFTNVIESAGYYSNALTSGTMLTAFPVVGTFATAGQVVVGGTNAQGDTVSLRYQADPTDAFVMTCQGTSPTDGLPHTSTFSLDANGNLQCSIDGAAAVTLISGVTALSIRYGVGSGIGQPNSAGTPDSYLTAADMNAVPLRWTNVYTVKVTLTFKNPLVINAASTKLQAGQAAAPAITFSRIISIKSRTGVNVANYI